MKYLFYFFLALACFQLDAAEELPNQPVRFTLNGKNTSKEAILLNAEANVRLNGVVTEVTLTHEFKNPSDDWAEGNYLFPLPSNAAVDKLTMTIGEKKIVGKIRKKKTAKKIYQAAVDNGQKAALLEMNRDNLFTAKAGNIPPHEKIAVTLHYVQPTHYDSGQFSLSVPTTFTPRYIVKNVASDEPLPEQHFSTSTKNLMKINIELDAGAMITELASNSHNIAPTIHANGKTASITTTEAKIAMNKDFHLHWRLLDNGQPLTLAFSEQTDDGYFTSLRVVPTLQAQTTTQPRDIALIIDTSGSMDGESIRQARAGALASLNYLNAGDRLNIIEFNTNFNTLFPSSQPVNDETLSAARHFITALKATGGTNMYEPLDAALSVPNDGEHLRQIVFLTDGAVDNEVKLFALIHDKLKQSRLFTVAIGSAPNDFFMRQAARAGRGDFTSISNINEVKDTIKTLFAKLQNPALTDLELQLSSSASAEIYPNPLPDVYQGKPIVAHLKTDTPPMGIELKGILMNKAWQTSVETTISDTNTAVADSPLAKLWAREKIAQLTAQKRYDDSLIERKDYDSEVETLGLRYQIVTEHTSFVAVEEALSRDTATQALKQKHVNNQIPAGMAFPATATSSTLTALLGSLLLLLAGLITLFSRRGAKC